MMTGDLMTEGWLMDDFLAYPAVQWINFVLRLLTLIFTLVFVIRYARRPWRTLPEGRHLMGFSCVVLAFMVISVFNNIMAWLDPHAEPDSSDGAYPGRQLIIMVLYAFTAWFMYKRNTLLVPEEKARQVQQDVDDSHDDRMTGATRDDGLDS